MHWSFCASAVSVAMRMAMLLCLVILLSCPVFAENSTNMTNANNTSFSRKKNLTKIDLESCDWGEVKPEYSIAAAVISGFLILDGGILCTFGFNKQRTAFSLLGFTIAGLVGYAIVEYRFEYSLSIQLLITGAIALFVSILCSSILYCGLFLTGLSSGFCIGSIVIVVISEVHAFGSFSEPVLILLGLAIAFASATVWWKRTFVIIGTSITGGAFIMGGIDYFVEGLLFTEYVQHIIYHKEFRRLCSFSWIVFSVFPVMALFGLLVQYFKTAKLEARPKSLSRQVLEMNNLSTTSQHPRV